MPDPYPITVKIILSAVFQRSDKGRNSQKHKGQNWNEAPPKLASLVNISEKMVPEDALNTYSIVSHST
jgi:hypothetical protein